MPAPSNPLNRSDDTPVVPSDQQVSARIRAWDRASRNWDGAQAQAAVLEESVRTVAAPRGAQLPQEFLRVPRVHAGGLTEPGLAVMARAGDTRLKLYLWLWWHDQHFGKNPDQRGVRWPTAWWAQLLALDEPDTNGARAVGKQLTWLAANNYLTRDGRRPAHLAARNHDGSQLTYDRPTAYVGLPANFWTGGWITRLSPRAIAALLIVMDYARPRIRISDATTAPAVFIHEGELLKHFALSVDFFHDGLNELHHRELVTTEVNKKWKKDGGYGGRWTTIDLDALRGTATQPHRPELEPATTENPFASLRRQALTAPTRPPDPLP